MSPRDHELKRLARLSLILIAGWTGLLGYSLLTTLRSEEAGAMAMAVNTARANFFKDQAFRLWASAKGGLYAVVDDHTRPVPYMAHVPGRDLAAVDGRQLTLMNPASMLREMMDQYAELYGIKGRIVGIVTLNPGNRADAWEENAIHAFERGEQEIMQVVDMEGQPHLRLIRPMVMQAPCMKCHGHLGFKIGDVRGAVDVSVPLTEYYATAQTLKDQTLFTHGAVWLIGLVGGGLAYRVQRRRIEEREASLKDMALAARVFDDALQGIAITDPNGIIVRVNKAFTDITGYSAAEAIGRKTSLVKSGLQDKAFYEEMWQSILAKGQWRGELWNRRKDGSLYAISEHNTALLDEDGRVRHFISMFEDITERKKRNAALQESEARYREAQRTARLGHWSYDTRSETFIWWSEETFRLLGMDPAAGHPDYQGFIEHVHPDDREKLNSVVARCLEDHSPFTVNYRVPLADGSIRHLEARGEAHVDSAGIVSRMSGTVMDVSLREEANQRLHTFRALAEASMDAIVIADPGDVRITYANRAAHDMFGCDFGHLEMIGKPGDMFWPADGREAMEAAISQAVASGWRDEVRLIRKEGSAFEASVSAFAIPGPDGKPQHIVGIISDISDKKRAEAELQTALAKLEAIIDFLPDATMVIDAQGRVIAWNQAMEGMTGMAKADILGKGDHAYGDAFYGHRRPMLIDFVLEGGNGGEQHYARYERHGDMLVAEAFTPEVFGGRGAYVWATALPLRDSRGEITGAIECVRDITEAKSAEEALKQNEERLRLALEGTSDGIWDWDLRTDLTYFSPRYYTMLGYRPGEFPANLESWKSLIHPDDLEGALARVKEHIAHGEGSFAIEFRCRCKDGGWRWILGRGKVVDRDAQGNPVRLAGSHTDISSGKAVEAALKLTQFTVDNATDAVFWYDARGRFSYANEQACKLLGYSQSELMGLSIPDVDAVTTSATLGAKLQDLVHKGFLQFESVLRRKDGTLFPVEISTQYLRYGAQDNYVAHIRDITERKRSENALLFEKNFSDSVINSLPGVFYLFDDGARLVRWNRNLSAITGHSPEALKGMHALDLVPEEERHVLSEAFSQTFVTGSTSRESHLLAKDGRRIPYVLTGLHMREGGRDYLVGAGIDISERKQAEETLKLTQFGVESSADAFYLIDPHNRFLGVNQAACASLGYARDELLSMAVDDIDPDIPEHAVRDIFDELRDKRVLRFETRHRRKDGSVFPVEVMANYVSFGGREYNFCFARDITERKAAEEQFRAIQYAIDHSSVAFEWLSHEGEVVTSNIHAYEALGYAREEFIGLHVWDYDPTISQDRWGEFWSTLTQAGNFTVETLHRRKDGSVFPVEVTASHVRFGGRAFCFAYINDITGRKAAEQALLDLNAGLEARVQEELGKNREKDHLLIQQSRLAAMGEMIGNIAHQWRQPINALSLVLANIKDAFEYGDLDKDYLACQVYRGGQLIHKMSTTIDDFRNFFRPDRTRQVFSLDKAVRDALMVVEVSYAHARIGLELEPGEDVYSLGFPNEYAQVVLNLLGNAKNAITERSIPAGTVRVRVFREGGMARVTVGDNGGGIPEDVLPKVFDPYFTTREQGTGIGLYMSRMIIENMGGRIDIANADGGARITLSTPLAAAPPADGRQ